MRDVPAALSEMVSGVSAETLFREAIETLTVGMVLLDLEGRIRYANFALCEMLGYTEKELQGRRFVELSHTDHRDALDAGLTRLAKGELESLRQETRSLSRGGSVLRISAGMSLLRRRGGEPQALMGMIEDVTRGHVVDQALRQLYREREALLDSAAEGIYGVDLNGRCTFVNRSAAEMLGYTQDELLGRNLHQMVHAKHPDGSPFPLESCPIARAWSDPDREAHHVRDYVATLWRKDGSSLPVEHSAEAVVVDGEVRGTVMTLRDVSERHVRRQEREVLLGREQSLRRQAEQLNGALQTKERALREALAEQLQLMEAIPQMVWVTGPQGEPEYVNERWRSFTAKPMGDRLSDWLLLTHPDDRDWTAQQFAASLSTKRPYEVEHRMQFADGSYRWVLSRAQPLIDAAGNVTHWFGTSTDIHERKMADDLLRRTEKLAAAGRLAATVAHEINNPLEAVGNLLYLAMHEPSLPATASRYLQMANEELRRVGHIVSQTLGFYRESSQPQTINLGTLVSDVLALYQRKLEARQIRVTRKVDSAVTVEGIAGELRQVLANLLSNALDAMEPNGVLGVEVKAERNHACITMSDTGHGIAPPLLAHIFEPFFTTKKDVGTGLGLWVSKGIVEKHHGRLEVMSSQGKEDHGTAFVMTLPRRPMLRSAS